MRTTKAAWLSGLHASDSSSPGARRTLLRFLTNPICTAMLFAVTSVGEPITWEQVYYAPPSEGDHSWSGLNAVTYGKGLFVAVGSDIAVSTNGFHWYRTNSPTVVELLNVIYAAGKFVAVGGAYYNVSGPDRMSAIVVSEDGINWTNVLEEEILESESDPNGYRTLFLTDLAWVGSQYVAVGNGVGRTILASTNGLFWQPVSTPVQRYCQSIAYSQGQTVIVGSGTLRSSDALVWTPGDLGPWGSCNLLSKVRHGFGRFVAGGNTGTMLSSSNGVTWSIDCQRGDFAFMTGLAFGYRSAISLGTDLDRVTTVLTAERDLKWKPEDIGGALPPPPTGLVQPGLNAVAFGEGSFVAVGDYHLILRGSEVVSRPVLSGYRLAPNGTFQFEIPELLT